jgi:radical SAM superfamily enzyme YgiQ (UPF0313 family)
MFSIYHYKGGKMKITLIKPNIGKKGDKLYVDEGRMEPLQLGVIAGLTPEDVDIALYDDRIEDIPYDEPTDLVAITVEIFTAKRAYEISAEYRKRGVKVILGGIHTSLIPEESAEYADSIFTGDAEYLWHEVIEDIRHGKLKPRYDSRIGNPQPNTLTRRDIYKGKGYLPISLMQFSRGCVFDCNFCASSAYFNKRHYCRKVEDIVREIEEQNLKTIFFVDDNIIANKMVAKELFRALIPLKIKWGSQASINMTEDTELMDLMMKSGCLMNVVGFESINLKNIKVMGKRPNLNRGDMYKKEIKILKDYGMMLWAAFLIGYDYDTPETIMQTTQWAIENKFCFGAFNVLMPYPKTQFYEKMKMENRLLYDGKWWIHPDYKFNHAAFIPKNMTADELTEAAFKARKKYNSITSIIRRLFDFKTNLKSLYTVSKYLIYTTLFRKEVYKKQDLSLGLEGDSKTTKQKSHE